MPQDYKCRCGEKKPYRRAYLCKECWAKISDVTRTLLERERHTDAQGTLRLKSTKLRAL